MCFGDGQTLNVPTQRKHDTAISAFLLNNCANTVEASKLDEKSTDYTTKSTDITLPTMPVEKGHKILAHRSIRSLISGSLHNVWADYRFVISPDDYCESCKIAASQVKNLSKKELYIPEDAFKCIFMDVIPYPTVDGLDISTKYPTNSIAQRKFKWFWGMKDH